MYRKYFQNFIAKYQHIIAYIIFGGLTTLVNFAVFIFFTKALNINYLVSNSIAWFISVVFAFITNKIFVFESKNYHIKHTSYEFAKFLFFRVFSGVLETLILFLMVESLGMNELIVKIFASIIVVISNYFFSKLIIFR